MAALLALIMTAALGILIVTAKREHVLRKVVALLSLAFLFSLSRRELHSDLLPGLSQREYIGVLSFVLVVMLYQKLRRNRMDRTNQQSNGGSETNAAV